ncbi:MAG: MerR family transcriptional regulator [Anaerovoracaceae bacterium]|jgi:DNA-binding transcriptional MerR regulator/effector-binding domain-containing protein
MQGYFSIGEVSKIFGLNVRTLRYYDDIGLLKPAHVDEHTGYRYYTSAQFERVDTIKYLRALDIPISQIKRLFLNADVRERADILEEQRKQVREKISELESIERKIGNRLSELKGALEQEPGNIVMRMIPDREIALIRTENQSREGGVLERHVMIFRDKSSRKAVVFQGKIGVTIFAENINAGKFDSYDQVFVILDSVDPYEGDRAVIPGGEYVTVMYSGSHDEAPEYYRKLMKYIHDHDLEVRTGSVEFSIIDSGITNDREKYVSEIQIGVKRKK